MKYALALALSFIAGTAFAQSPNGAPLAHGSSSLEGDWRIAAFFDPALGALDAPFPGASVSFHGGQIAGNGGCNSFWASFWRRGASLRISAVSMTKRMCFVAAPDEGVIVGHLAASRRVMFQGPNNAQLMGAGGVTLLRLER